MRETRRYLSEQAALDRRALRTAAGLFVAASILLGGCRGASEPAPADDQASETDGRLERAPAIDEGVQIVRIEAGKMGFDPPEVSLRAGVPARLVFTRTVESSCVEQIQVPDFGIDGRNCH